MGELLADKLLCSQRQFSLILLRTHAKAVLPIVELREICKVFSSRRWLGFAAARAPAKDFERQDSRQLR
jgi:hypothetical protein